MIDAIPSNTLALLVTVGGLILEVTVLEYKANLNYGKSNKSGLTGSGPAFRVQHKNKQFIDNAWVTYTGADRWKPWGKVWIEPARLFQLTDLKGAQAFLADQNGGDSGGGAGGAGAGSPPRSEQQRQRNILAVSPGWVADKPVWNGE